MSQGISSRLGKFLYCLENEQWLLPSNYSLFQIHFSTDFLSHSLSHLNIIFSFIIYSFFNNYTSFNIFFIQYLIIIIIEKKNFEEWTVTHQTCWVTVHEKKIWYRESIGEWTITYFVGLGSKVERILCLALLSEMLSVQLQGYGHA